ncbi:protein terminal ear1 homolog [Vitis riparia]|nr:protein terminal ear1 homolog [Vitis riparia]
MLLLLVPQSGRFQQLCKSSMADEKTLNPQAPEFIPTSLFSSHYSPPNLFLFYHNSFSTPFFTPLYSTSYLPYPSLFISPQRVFSPVPLQLPPPMESPVVEASSEDDTQVEKQAVMEKKVVVEKFSPRIVSKGVRNRWVLRKGGGGQGFRGHENQNKQAWRVRVGDGDRNRYCGKVELKPITRKKNPKDVLPIQPGSNDTTVMIRNVPNKYTREMLLQFLDEHCMKENQKLGLENSEEADQEERIVSAFDFLYLPIDFDTGMNKSYAFVNFTHPKAVWRFHFASHNQKWELFHSKKIREIVCAKIQGKEALVKHFEKMSFACEWDEFLPLCFSPARDGSRELVKQSTVGSRVDA